MKNNFFDGDEERAEDFCYHIHGMCKFEFEMQSIMESFNEQSINFRDIDQVNEVVSHITALQRKRLAEIIHVLVEAERNIKIVV